MSDPVAALVVDLLEWIGTTPRPYAEVMEAWRTSCPRLPVWEEANARGFLTHRHREGVGSVVGLSRAGLAHLAVQRPQFRSQVSELDVQSHGESEARRGPPSRST